MGSGGGGGGGDVNSSGVSPGDFKVRDTQVQKHLLHGLRCSTQFASPFSYSETLGSQRHHRGSCCRCSHTPGIRLSRVRTATECSVDLLVGPSGDCLRQHRSANGNHFSMDVYVTRLIDNLVYQRVFFCMAGFVVLLLTFVFFNFVSMCSFQN